MSFQAIRRFDFDKLPDQLPASAVQVVADRLLLRPAPGQDNDFR